MALRTDGAEPQQLMAVGLDEGCRFELTVPDGPSRMVLVATGDGKPVEMPIVIPPQGDPEPICMNPPCQAEPLAATARLRIAFLGADHTDVSATLTFAGDDHSSSYTCFTNGEDCELDALPISQPFTLSAEAADCAAATRIITLHAGDNDVSFPCDMTTSTEIGLESPGDEVPNEVQEEIQGDIQVQEGVVVE